MTQLIARKRVLIADDEPELRALIRDTIAGTYDVLEAATGEQVIQVAETTHLDAILLDVRMPETDGLTVCRRLRSSPDQADVQVILISGQFDRKGRQSSLVNGADYYLPKPFTPQALRQLLYIACSTETGGEGASAAAFAPEPGSRPPGLC